MAPADDLVGLLRQLEGARTPLERLRRVALAWREVRRLNRDEREQLAAHLGLEEADTLLERLAVRRGGLAPAELLRAVRAAQQADPRELQDLVHGLVNPATRRATVIQGLAQLESRLAREAGSDEGEAATPPPPVGGGEEVAEAGGEAEQQAAIPAAVPPAPAVKPLPEAPPPELPPPVPVPREPPRPHAAPSPGEPVPREQRGWAALRERGQGQTARVSGEAAQPGDDTGAAPRELAAALAGDASLAARLGRLHRALAAGEVSPEDELVAVLETFPDGWPRRRALAALFEAGYPADGAIALALVELLAAERDRAWCLAVLARTGMASLGALATAAEALSSPALRRRLLRLSVS